jgi:hypothetical protein
LAELKTMEDVEPMNDPAASARQRLMAIGDLLFLIADFQEIQDLIEARK